jgi:uncharacterized protein
MSKTFISFQVQIQPKSSRDEITGVHDGRLKIKIAALPVEGKANDRLISFIAKSFGVPKSGVEIVKGKTSKLKTVKVAGLDQEAYNDFLSKFRQ